MVAPVFTPCESIPSEALVGAAQEGECDADAVGEFLKHLGYSGTQEHPLVVPGGFLLELAAALRFLKWETLGIRVHRDAGIPSAAEAVRQTFLRYSTRGQPEPAPVYRPALAALSSRLAWEGPSLLGGEFELSDIDDDVLVDALANLLWARQKAKKHADGKDNQHAKSL